MNMVKRAAAVVVAGIMVFSLAGCKKSKKITSDDFVKAAEKIGLTCDKEGDAVSATNDDDTIKASFTMAESTDDAKEAFDFLKENYIGDEDAIKDEGIDVKSTSNKFEASDDSHYLIVARNDKALVFVMAEGEDQVSKAKDMIKDLGL